MGQEVLQIEVLSVANSSSNSSTQNHNKTTRNENGFTIHSKGNPSVKLLYLQFITRTKNTSDFTCLIQVRK